MQQENKRKSPSDTPRNYVSLRSTYSYHGNEYQQPQTTNASAQGLMSGSQPSTPRPGVISPPPDKVSTTPDLIRKRPRLPSRPASFTTTTFHSNPYSNHISLRRRRTDSSMFSFEAGPTFNQTKQLLDLWNLDQSNGYQIQLHAKMDRGFFRAEQDWTCYRRNYFQVSSTFEIHGIHYLMQGPEVPCLLRTETQELFQIDYFTIGITARVNGSDKKIAIVQHTPKRDKGPQIIPGPRVVSAGGDLHLASVGSHHNIVTFERMQFKTATANNGKRRAAQQYYEIVVDLFANSSTGKTFKVATTVSTPLVVRGRSPGHYADSHTEYKSTDAGHPSSVSFAGQGAGSTTNTVTNTDYPRYNNNDFYSSYQPHQNSNYPYQPLTPMLNDEKDNRSISSSYMTQPQNNDYHDNNRSYWIHRDNNSSHPDRYSHRATTSSLHSEFNNSYHPMRSTDNKP